MRIVQLIPALSAGDAVSNDAVAMHRCLCRWDKGTKIYSPVIGGGVTPGVAEPLSALPELGEEDVLIYHMAIGSDVSLRIDELPCRKVMVYHNITPPAYFEPYSASSAESCRCGYAELERMRDWFDYCIADSDYNRQGLREAGYTCPIDVCPVMVPPEDYERPGDERTRLKYSDGRTNILFVGRVVPQKKHEDVIRAFACYQERYDPDARLILAGSDDLEPYTRRLKNYVRALGVRNVRLTGHISFPELLSLYRTADALLCMSEHEGFCVPLLEAMFFDLPVVALRRAAVGETLGGSGVLLEEADPGLAAEALHRLMTDESYRAEIVASERERREILSPDRSAERFEELIRAFLETKPIRRSRIVQLLPKLSSGDAVSGDALALHTLLGTLPRRADLWTYECGDPLLRSRVRCSRIPPLLREDDIAVFHMASGGQMAEDFLSLRCRKVMIYHSITPPEYFAPYSDGYTNASRRGRRLTERLIAACELCIADSEHNKAELLAMGAKNVKVLPILTEKERFGSVSEALRKKYADGRTNVLFVGRIAPNKKIENVIRAFGCYQERYDPDARLLLCGADDVVPDYTARLRRYIDGLGVGNVYLTGRVSDEELAALYRSASVFLCMSEHEGFCVPLLEAMNEDVPVAALDAAAVGETLGGAGVLLPDDDPAEAAEAIRTLMTDAAYRADILMRQRERREAFAPEAVAARAEEIFREVEEERA